MRYYRIDIGGQTLYTSHPSGPGGPPDPGALMVDLDLPQGVEHAAMGAGTVKVYGVGIETISQAQNFTSKSIAVYGGMGVGLPLATQLQPQSGLLVQGSIYPAFGAWVGTDQSITFIIQNLPAEGEFKPANIVVQHQQGDKLGDVVKKTLTTAYPGYDVNVNVSDRLVLDHQGAGFYATIESFAKATRNMSLSIFDAGGFLATGNYPGVQIATHGTTINVTDGQQGTSGAKVIQYYDLLGQPTWVGLNTISVTVVMRGDIQLLDMVTLPPTIAQSTAQSNPQLRDNSVFQGTFMVKEIRHIGNSRAADSMAWSTVLTLISTNSPGN